jgi:hypothetical protein
VAKRLLRQTTKGGPTEKQLLKIIENGKKAPSENLSPDNLEGFEMCMDDMIKSHKFSTEKERISLKIEGNLLGQVHSYDPEESI